MSFTLLVQLAAFSISGQRHLKLVRDRLTHDDGQRERLRVIVRALW